jgi:hypothetical protein
VACPSTDRTRLPAAATAPPAINESHARRPNDAIVIHLLRLSGLSVP